jgi:hypothetical protein
MSESKLKTETINRQARDQALKAMQGIRVEPTSLVNYQSRGRVAVIGDQSALEIAPRLNDRLSPVVVLTQGIEEPGTPVVPVGGRGIHLAGYQAPSRYNSANRGGPMPRPWRWI